MYLRLRKFCLGKDREQYHIQHALTVEAVMKWYASELGYGDQAEYWGIVGLLHDIDFEQYPQEHCLKAPQMLREAGVGEDIIHAVVSHGYGITVGCGETIDVAPEHEMEKVLFAAGCSREVIQRGAEQLGWELEQLLTMTLQAMAVCEDEIKAKMDAYEGGM